MPIVSQLTLSEADIGLRTGPGPGKAGDARGPWGLRPRVWGAEGVGSTPCGISSRADISLGRLKRRRQVPAFHCISAAAQIRAQIQCEGHPWDSGRCRPPAAFTLFFSSVCSDARGWRAHLSLCLSHPSLVWRNQPITPAFASRGAEVPAGRPGCSPQAAKVFLPWPSIFPPRGQPSRLPARPAPCPLSWIKLTGQTLPRDFTLRG